QNFVGLFDEVGSQRLMRLLAIPRASARRAQSGLNTDELVEPLTGAPLFLIRPWPLPAAGAARVLALVRPCSHAVMTYLVGGPTCPSVGRTRLFAGAFVQV